MALLAILLSPAGPASSATPDDTLQLARQAARTHRNGEAADRFADTIRAAPERRRELLAEYADQLLYSDRAQGALQLYLEILHVPLSDDERQRAEKGAGLALLWTDRAGEALPIWRKVVAESPDNEDASRNLGRALSWSGRQREAIRHVQAHIQSYPKDDEARVILAQAQAWVGLSGSARATLKRADRSRIDVFKLDRQLNLEAAPKALADYQRSTQSDHLAIRNARVAQVFNFSEGRGSVGLQAERILYNREDGSDSASVSRPMLQGRYRWNETFEVHSQVGQDRIQLADGTRHNPGVYATWLTWWPNDLLRFDASTNRETFDNLQSLRLGLTARQHGLSADLTPSERLRLTLRLQRGEYSDGNRRDWSQLEGEYRVRTKPDSWLGLRATQFSFSKQLNNGYFNPLRFRSEQLTLRTSWQPDGDEGRWTVAVVAAIGREHAVPDGSKPASDFSLRTSYRINNQMRIVARAQRFSSRTATSTGFARTLSAISLERSW